ncbi:MAG: Ig-like domain-containing protein [Candidatus Cloacimonetes bacterium]|nr:Ig-like domain-containing protein [Candidatus Cloacimonadota bacterium]
MKYLKKQIVFFLIISFICFFNCNTVFASENNDRGACYGISSVKDINGNDLLYGKIIAYVQTDKIATYFIENGKDFHIEPGYYPLIIPYNLEDINKEIKFFVEIDDISIEAIPDFQVILDNNHQDETFGTLINLTVSNLPSLITSFDIEYNNQILSDDIITVNKGDLNNICIKVYGDYSNGDRKEITNKCEYSGNGDVIKLVDFGEFKFLKWENNDINVSYGNLKKKLSFNIIDNPPTLFTSSLTDNATDISINNTFTFHFDKSISQGNNFGSISLLNSDGVPVGITKTVSSDTLIIKPIIDLKYDSSYILSIPSNSIKNLGTMGNTENILYHFTTISEVPIDTIAKSISVESSGGIDTVEIIPNVHTYTFTLPEGTTISPTISVDTGNNQATVVIPPISIIPGSVEITIRSKDGTKVEKYIINIELGNNDQCFIATAAYGSLLEPHVQVLRKFRDNILMQFNVGRWFVKNYYHYSPPIANIIANNEVLKFVVRMILTPIIFSIEYWKGLLISLIGVGIVIGWRRKIVLN